MSVLYIVIPLALIVVGGAVAAFLWAARRGQFDDLETPAVRALHDDAPGKRPAPTPEPKAEVKTPDSGHSGDLGDSGDSGHSNQGTR